MRNPPGEAADAVMAAQQQAQSNLIKQPPATANAPPAAAQQKPPAAPATPPLAGGDRTPSSPGAARQAPTNQKIGPYVLGVTLGVGSTGRVKLGTHIETGQTVAVKIIPRESLRKSRDPGGQANAAANNRKIEREITIMKLIKHPNVLQLYDVYETDNELFLVLEHVEGGELFDYLVKKGRLNEDEALDFFQQIIFGLDFCHRHLICHRDLKPENLLLDSRLNVKIADFGMASMQPTGRLLETSCGSPHYASPEIIRGVRYNGTAADIWSCGVILFALLTGNLPFDDENIRRLLGKVKSGQYNTPEHISAGAEDLIRKILVVDATRRITMPGIMSHPWFTKRTPRNGLKPVVDSEAEKLAAEPIEGSEQGFQQDIIENLQLLGWSNEADLLEALRSNELRMEKIFYRLLERRKKEYFENYDERENFEDFGGHSPRRRTGSSASAHAERARSESHLGGRSRREDPGNDSDGSDSSVSLSSETQPRRRMTMDVKLKYAPSMPSTAVKVNSPLVSSFNNLSMVTPEEQAEPPPSRPQPPPAAVPPDPGKRSAGVSADLPTSAEERRKLNITIPKNDNTNASIGSPKFHRRAGKIDNPQPSPVIPSSPKRSWFANLFNFKPEAQSFTSTLSREDTFKKIEEMMNKLGLGPMRVYARKDNVLKVKYEGRAEASGQLGLKSVKFRIEIASSGGPGQSTSSNSIVPEAGASKELTILLTQSQGAFSSFQAICEALKSRWEQEQ